MKRKMAAILAGDIVGYSAMMERAEEQTAERLQGCHSLISQKVDLLDGRVFNTAGDSAFAEFPSAVNAVRAAFEIRAALAGMQDKDRNQPLSMRFGVHVADVLVQGDDLVGDGVNVAARIQAGAEPGDIVVSGALFEHVRRNSPFIFDDLGDRVFKNISEPVRVYRLRDEIGKHRLQSAPTRMLGVKTRRPSSVAVLPFRVAAGEGQRYLADGLAEELIVELGRFPRLSVSSRSASFAIAELNPDPVKVGELLGVQFVIEGRVRTSAGQVAISLTLSETEQGSVVWSDKTGGEDVLGVLDSAASRIAATVSGRVEHAAIAAARRKGPDNMTAFDCLLRGLDNHRLGGVTDANAQEAVRWFTKAIEADPNYAAAYAWRVCAGSWLSTFDLKEGRRDIRRALELDPGDAEANRIMGSLEHMNGNFDEAVAHHARAAALNPTDAYIKSSFAAALTAAGDPESALRLLDEAETLDPFLPVYCVEARGVALYALGRLVEALDSLGRLTFQTTRSRLYRAAALVALGRQDEARRIVREVLGAKPDLNVSAVAARELYRDPELARELGRRLSEAGLPQ